ncbi:hypothetical protein ACFV5N_23825 [Streptomyces sp. NPDC059853]|uniref:hypothetical protein n=1 Tax=Streptomyces sp. NPDC059853 TaxID=3346973 RepID=UPI0036692685
MGSHSRPSRPVLRIAAVTAAATGAVVAGAGAASASTATDNIGAALAGADTALTYGLAGPLDLQLYPMGGTGVDPLTNGVSTQIADFPSVGTTTLTQPLTDGASAKDLLGGLTAPVTSLLGGLPLLGGDAG